MIQELQLIHFVTVTCIVETFFLFLFRFTNSPLTGNAINQWYTNLRWSAVILDVLSVLIGFYISKFLYLYLVDKDIISKDNELLKFLGIVLLVQITHDFSFYFLIIKNAKKGMSKVMDEFIYYSKSIQTGAVIGDSLMYLMGVPLLFLIYKNSNDINVFITLFCLYLTGYFVYEKPRFSIVSSSKLF